MTMMMMMMMMMICIFLSQHKVKLQRQWQHRRVLSVEFEKVLTFAHLLNGFSGSLTTTIY